MKMRLRSMQSERSRRLVLAVEGEPDGRHAFRLDLENEFDVIGAGDAGTALALAHICLVDAVLLDLPVPGIDGLELLKRLGAVRPGMKVIVVTAMADTRTAVAAMKLGAVDYLVKPFD